MNISKQTMTALVKSVLRGSKAYGAHNLVHPQREWLFGLGCFAVLLVLAAWWTGSFYVRFKNPDNFASGEAATTTIPFRPQQIEAAQAALAERALRYKEAEALLRSGGVALPVDAEEVSVATSTEADALSETTPVTEEVLPQEESVAEVSVPTESESEPVTDNEPTEPRMAI